MVTFSDFRYLLSFHNVAPDYKTDFEAFLQKNGVSVEEGLDDQPHLDLGTSKNSEDPNGVMGLVITYNNLH